MLNNNLSTFTLGLFFSIFIFIGRTEAQTTINFTEFPIFAEVSEKYASQGVLFSSRNGTPIINKDSIVTGKVGLCARGRRSVYGFPVPICNEIYVGFVSRKQKMVMNLAKHITIKILAVGAVTAFWTDKEGNSQHVQASLSREGDFAVSIPGETEGVLLMSSDSDCVVCNFIVTRISFVLSHNSDPICDNPVMDAGFSFRNLINEDYPQAIYDRLDEFRQPNLPFFNIRLRQLQYGHTTYYDEYAIIVRLPDDNRRNFAQEIFTDMRRKLDTVGLGKPAGDFTSIGEFTYYEPDRIIRRSKKLPTVGDIFQVAIRGPENGDVMMTELVESPLHSRFRYSTLNNFLPEGNGRHPNSGSREYGYFKTWDGWTKFYVRGIDQFRHLPGAAYFGRPEQDRFWLSFLKGIGNRVKFYNGEIRYPATKTIDETLDDVPRCHVPPRSGYGVTGLL